MSTADGPVGLTTVFPDVIEALTDHDPRRRDLAAETLDDVLRGSALDTDTARLLVGHLVRLAVEDPVTGVRESALNAIGGALRHHRLPFGLVGPLGPAMRTMTPELLLHSLFVLGATHDERARPLLEPFLRHPDPEVRAETRLAMDEITAASPPPPSA
ncbi:hypothetical protein [Streptomyces sp. HB132]|uniref:HEAT repeat domain-containing protein n=1 Tax=Streptomyces sp. HB132 TaxID=767388 RepID=UPI001D4A6123|nr:hypothetical protein [Streptomyces sp. HB132]MBM7436865.1 HEAT repeat protein [Streptomyces sp. HB132]